MAAAQYELHARSAFFTFLSKVVFFKRSRSVEPKMIPLKCSVQWRFAPQKWLFLRSKRDDAKSTVTRAVC